MKLHILLNSINVLADLFGLCIPSVSQSRTVPLCINGQTGAKKKCCFSFGKRQNAIQLEELRVFVFFFLFSLFRMAKAGLEKNQKKKQDLNDNK